MNGPVLRSTPTRPTLAKRRGAAGLLAVLALASCGSDGSDARTEPASTEPASTEPASTDRAGTEPAGTDPAGTGGSAPDEMAGPVSTVPADLPEYLVGEIGALDVTGEALPMFGGDTAADPAVGLAAPVLVGADFDGNPVRVDAATDGPTMLVFLAHYCPHCNAEVPVLNALRDAGSFPEDLQIIAVSTAVSPDRPNFPPSEWFNDMGWTYPVIADGVDMNAGTFIGTAAYGVDAFPFVTLIDVEGNVAARWNGESPAAETLERISTHLGL